MAAGLPASSGYSTMKAGSPRSRGYTKAILAVGTEAKAREAVELIRPPLPQERTEVLVLASLQSVHSDRSSWGS
jgi:hypothetical protein